MLKIGITGGMGSGKTTVAKLFEKNGIAVFYSDVEAKKIMWQDSILKAKIKTIFGHNAFHKNGRLNRTFLASQIFTDKSKLKKLNSIVHPAVATHFIKWSQNQNSKYVIEESALIFEIGIQNNFDKTILVTAPTQIRIQRILKRDKTSKAAIQNRMKNQWSDERKKKLADYIINNGNGSDLNKQVQVIHNKLLSL